MALEVKRKREDGSEAIGNGAPRPRTQQAMEDDDANNADEVDWALLESLERDTQVVEALDIRGVKKLVLSFEKKLRDNLEARMKHMEHPERFMDTEVELDEEVKRLHALAGAPELYPELVRLNAVSSILGLLSHENTDIAIDVVNLLHDLTDGDVVGDNEEEALVLVDALVANNAMEILVQNLSRLDEADPDEATAVFNTLGIMENMVEVKPEVAELVCERTKLLRWLLTRVIKREFDSNKLYSSEILAILLQSSTQNQRRVGQLNGVDTLLQAVAMYKSRDPKTSEEEELVENLFDALCSVVMPGDNKERFVKAEGVELMIIVMKQKKRAYASALKALDFATTRCPAACERFVDVLGLKTLFAAFMGKVVVKRKAKGDVAQLEEQIDERSISIVASLFGGLSKGARRERLLSKFTESEFEKVDRLMEFYLRYSDRVIDEERRQTEQKTHDDVEMSDEERYLSKLEAGLFTLQLLALILAHIWAANLPGVHDRIDLLLKQQRLSRTDVKTVLQEYQQNIGDVDGIEEKDRRKARIQKLLSLM